MKQLTMLVTAEGRWVLPDSDEFLAALGDPNPDYDAVGFAVRNLGFIKFHVLDRLVTEIELHPRNVDLRALLAVEAQLDKAGTNLFRIKYLDTEWRSEISPSAAHTVTRLRELCAATAPIVDPASTERFRAEAQDFSALFGSAERHHGFGPMALKWRVAFGNFDLGIMGIADRNNLSSRLVIVGFEPRGGRPILRFFGDAHRWAGNSYRVEGLGLPVEDMPDKEYGGWLSQFYQSVASTGQPRYDLITAQMEYRNEPGKPRRTARYERLLLPWRTPSAEVLVTSCIKLVPDVPAPANLRVEGSDSSSSRNVPKSS